MALIGKHDIFWENFRGHVWNKKNDEMILSF